MNEIAGGRGAIQIAASPALETSTAFWYDHHQWSICEGLHRQPARVPTPPHDAPEASVRAYGMHVGSRIEFYRNERLITMQRRLFLQLIASTLAIHSAAPMTAPAAEPETPRLRVLTYNIHHGEGRD
jgi:hypothetical protein